MTSIFAQELKDRLSKGEKPFILDVRESADAQRSNIGGKNIPNGELPNRISEINIPKDSEIIVHCYSGGRSRTAIAFLESQGFTNCKNLEGGINSY